MLLTLIPARNACNFSVLKNSRSSFAACSCCAILSSFCSSCCNYTKSDCKSISTFLTVVDIPLREAPPIVDEFVRFMEPIRFLSASLFLKDSCCLSCSRSTNFIASSCFRLCSSKAFSLSGSDWATCFSELNIVNFSAS
jgi:hypothetical protein